MFKVLHFVMKIVAGKFLNWISESHLISFELFRFIFIDLHRIGSKLVCQAMLKNISAALCEAYRYR